MNLKYSAIAAVLITLVVMITWELHVRSQGYVAALTDSKGLWAVQRARMEKMSSEDVVFIGSSRVHFGIQLDEWEEVTGVRPIMLAADGSNPAPVFKDIVENSSFSGTVVIGVAPGLFFSAPVPFTPMWKRVQNWVDHYHDRTYADRLNHLFSLPLERAFAFLNSAEEEWADDIDLKSLINRIDMGDRLGNKMPPFYNFSYVDEERNTFMFEKTVTDTAFANTIINVWMFFGKNAPPPVKDEVIELYVDLITKFRERGGKVIFLRMPSSEGFLMGEKKGLPRDQYWDVLLERTETTGYHFEEYRELQGYVLPEWSHLSTPDAKVFTRDLARIMINDQVIPNLN